MKEGSISCNLILSGYPYIKVDFSLILVVGLCFGEGVRRGCQMHCKSYTASITCMSGERTELGKDKKEGQPAKTTHLVQ